MMTMAILDRLPLGEVLTFELVIIMDDGGDDDDDDGNFGQVATRRGVDISDKGALCPFHTEIAREQHTRHLTFNSLHIFHTGCLTFNNLQHCAEYKR